MNRRDAVVTLATAATGLPLMVLAADKPAAKPPGAAATAAASAASPYLAAIAASRHCIGTGEACFELALTQLKKGDTSMAECSDTTRAMVDTCGLLIQLARANNPNTRALAALCANVCRDCEKSCRKHELHHAECRACGESCAKCALECDKLAA